MNLMQDFLKEYTTPKQSFDLPEGINPDDILFIKLKKDGYSPVYTIVYEKSGEYKTEKLILDGQGPAGYTLKIIDSMLENAGANMDSFILFKALKTYDKFYANIDKLKKPFIHLSKRSPTERDEYFVYRVNFDEAGVDIKGFSVDEISSYEEAEIINRKIGS